MPIVSISPQHQGRGGGRSKDNRGFYTAAYVVVTDDPYDDAAVVMAGSPSRIGDAYNNGLGFTDNKSFCVRLRPEQDNATRNVWRLYADFEPQDRQRTVIKVTYEKKKKALVGVRKSGEVITYNETYDANGGVQAGVKKITNLYGPAIANSFGDAFDPAPEYEVSYLVVTFRRREAAANLELWNSFKDAVNDSGWAAAAPLCAKVMSIEAEHEYVYEGGVEKKIWWVTYKIGYDPERWTTKKLDAGYHFRYETGNAEGETAGKEGTFYDKDGITPRIGLLSNEAGAAGIKGIRLVDLSQPEYKEFETFPQRNFQLLNLPQNINIIEPP